MNVCGVPAPLLEGVLVVDLSNEVAGLFCGKLLADLGADVRLVREAGSPAISGMAPERAALWQPFLELGKHVHETATAHQETIALLQAHAGPAVVVTSARASGREAAFVYDVLRASAPKAVVVSVTPFGLSGGYAAWRSDELVEYAMGGQLNLAGDRRKPPLLLPGMQGQLHTGLQAAVGTLAAVRDVMAGGERQMVEVSAFECMLMCHSWTIAAWTHGGRVSDRWDSETVRCNDGEMMFVRRIFNPDLFVLMEQPELLGDERFSSFPAFIKNNRQFWETFEEWSTQHTRQEVWDRAQTLHIPSAPVLSMQEIAEHPSTAAREWVRRVGDARYPGNAWRLTLAPGGRPREVSRNAGPGPLAGIRVLELTTNWSGPLAGRELGDLGADVIKIELATRPASRGSYYAGKDAQNHHVNRSGYFNKMNRNKRDITLDLRRPEGRELFLKMVENADIVLENNSPRVMPNFGLSFADLVKRNPSIVMSSISGFGAEGPLRDCIAYGTNIEGSSGVVASNSYGEGTRYGTGNFHPDPVSGGYAALAMQAALLHREATGDAAFIDIALQDAGAAFMAESFLRYFNNAGDSVRPMDDSTTLRNVVKCIGIDSWLAVAVPSDVDLEALSATIEAVSPPPGSFAELREGEGRAWLSAELERWAKTVDHREGASMLQAAGVAAGPVYKNWEMASDNVAWSRGFMQMISHPETGTLPFPGIPWKLARNPGSIRRPAPLLGEHTREIATAAGGLSEAEVDALEQAGVIGGGAGKIAPLGLD